MKRPLLLLTISFALGIISAHFSHSYLFVLLTAMIALMIMLTILMHKRTLKMLLAGMLIFYLAGSFELLIRVESNEGKYNEYAGKQVVVEGYVLSDADIREAKTNYTIRSTYVSFEGKSKKVKGKLLLTVAGNYKDNLLDYGSKINIRGIINVPKGARNPGGFNYKEYLMKSDISATLFVVPGNIRVENGKYINVFVQTGIIVRNSIVNVINKSLPEQQAGLLNGMVIGYKGGLSKEVQRAFSDAGLSHIMAISGMNIAFIIAPLVFIFKKLRIREVIANPIIIAVLVIFVYITGFSPSVVRAVIMGIIILTGRIIRREPDILTSIAFSAVILLLYNPLLFFDVGFQLSYAATISVVLFYKNIKGLLNFKFLPGFIRDLLSVTVSAQIGVIPVTAYYFNKISIISLLSNLLVLPMVEIVTIIGFIMAFAGQFSLVLSHSIGYINFDLLSLILIITGFASEIPNATIRVITPSIALILVYYAAALFLFWYKPLYKPKISFKFYAIPVTVIMVLMIISILTPRKLEVVFIDVGEGDSAFIRTSSGKAVLIDGGGFNSRLSPEMNSGDSIIIPFLMDQGVTSLDAVVASHGHNDHIQGLITVLEELKVKNLIIPDNQDKKEFEVLLKIAGKKHVNIDECIQGDLIRLDNNTYFDVLSPQKGTNTGSTSDAGETSLNNSSLVLKLHYKDISFLFTGDIQKETEDILIADKIDLSADVLKIAHHGSVYSTQESFIKLVNPEAAVISVGKNNFGHPSALVIDRLIKDNVKLFRTDTDGAVIMTSDGENIKIRN